ncbi:MAG: glycosyltransferase family 4 protein [Solirubrobacteraceae bacterium]|nr:glycosyltransferase family 4 protein [Solirubrobacteraceae bacterium]
MLVVSGIWPPDVGGPASHGPAIGRFLAGRHHEVRAVVSGEHPEPAGFPVQVLRRDRPLPERMARGFTGLVGATRWPQVVYSTGMYHRTAIACTLTRTPLVIKLTSDPAYDRARNRGWFSGTLEAFQASPGDRRVDALKAVRDRALRRADSVLIPSRYLAAMAREWSLDASRVHVVPNPADLPAPSASREALRERFSMTGPTAVYIGRFALAKSVLTLVEAAAAVPGLAVVLIGDGPEREALQARIETLGLAGRVRLHPSVDRAGVADWFHAADLSVLPSQWENFPHGVVESLSVGTPVVASDVGGVSEILEEDAYGRLVTAGAADDLARAMGGLIEETGTLAAMRAAAAVAGARYRPDAVFGQIEAAVERAASTRLSRT